MKTRFFYGYVIVALATFVMFIMAGGMYSYGVFFKPLSEEFGWSRAITAGAHSMFLLLIGVFFIQTGRLVDRFGPRRVVTVCAGFSGLAYLLMSRINESWQLYLFWGLIAAIGQSGGLIPMMSTMTRWFVKRRGLMTGIVASGAGLGNMVMPPVVSKLIEIYDWRTTYLIMAVAIWVLVIGAAQFLKRDPEKVGQLPDGDTTRIEAVEAQQVTGSSRREALHSGRFWMLVAAIFCFGFFMHSIFVHIVPHARDMGVEPVAAAGVLATIGGLSTTGRIFMGGVGDRTGSKKAMVICFALALVSLLWLQIAAQLWMLYLFAIAFGFATGGMVSLESAIIADLFGLKAHGGIFGMVHFGVTAGGSLGTFLSGRLYDLTGGYQLIFWVYAALSFISLVLLLALKPPR
ncbi:MAG: MFS transporter [Chloroflexi bacterium]|nr:MFS transporter [Chloroflexota bacterium]